MGGKVDKKILELFLAMVMSLLPVSLGLAQGDGDQNQGRLVFSASGGSIQQSFDSDGHVAATQIRAASSNGATVISNLKTGYPAMTEVEVEATMSVAQGTYRVAFMHKGQKSLELSAQDGSSDQGRGLATVDSDGNLPYAVEAEQAMGMDMAVNVSLPKATE
ncbi:MAG: hypothetical protein LBP92_04900 [Deltaproteobacteria bacterium]|jgi:hypothetical protein|nr:hypothetical protein [Deltaproteobacteria bacterium]